MWIKQKTPRSHLSVVLHATIPDQNLATFILLRTAENVKSIDSICCALSNYANDTIHTKDTVEKSNANDVNMALLTVSLKV